MAIEGEPTQKQQTGRRGFMEYVVLAVVSAVGAKFFHPKATAETPSNSQQIAQNNITRISINSLNQRDKAIIQNIKDANVSEITLFVDENNKIVVLNGEFDGKEFTSAVLKQVLMNVENVENIVISGIHFRLDLFSRRPGNKPQIPDKTPLF